MERDKNAAQSPKNFKPESPQHELCHEDKPNELTTILSTATHSLQHDYVSGARQLASASLQHLSHLTIVAARDATSQDKLWELLVHAAKSLSRARPSMTAAITSCLLRALSRIKQAWEVEQPKLQGSQSTAELAGITVETIKQILQEREKANTKLAKHFTDWLLHHCNSVDPTSLHILTLSLSSTLRSALLYLFSQPRSTHPHIYLTVLESRPRCEGADLAAELYAAISRPSSNELRIVPDCAVASAVKDVDVVLLGADRISPTGDVKNKIGSLAAVLCAQHHAKQRVEQGRTDVAVVVLSDTDKIAASGQEVDEEECHPASELTTAWSAKARDALEGKEGVEVFGEWFEWVPAQYVDAYVTEQGTLGIEKVEGVASEVGELEKLFFHRND